MTSAIPTTATTPSSAASTTRRLREAHAHIASHGQALGMVSLAACTSADDCLATVADAARSVRTAAGTRWLQAIGARVEGWTRHGDGPCGWPTLAQLDQASDGVPCAMMSFDHHMVMANSAALRAARIDRHSADIPGGVISRDRAGLPDGLLLESAAWSLWGAAPEPSAAQRRQQVIEALQDLARHGFVEVHDMLSQPWLGPLLARLSDAGELPMRVWLYPPISDIESAAKASAAWSRPDVTLAGGKIFIDGTLNSRTAWMLHPYREPLEGMPTGKIITPPEAIESAIRTCRALSIGLAAHAIGDAAVRAALDAYERVSRDQRSISLPHTLSASLAHPVPPFRIEHAEVIDALDIPRFAGLGIVASMQPCHLLADIEALNRYLPNRLDRVFPLRELIDQGCRPGELLWFGSDTPIVRPDPTDSIQAAVHRRRESTHAADAIAMGQAITATEAWASFETPSPR